MVLQLKCICGKKGVTLIEVVAATLILSIGALGLSSVYVMAIQQWEDTVIQIRGQQAGSYIMEELVRTFQSATTVEKSGSVIFAKYKIPDLAIDSMAVISSSGGTLKKNGITLFPIPGIEGSYQKSITIKSINLSLPMNSDSLCKLELNVGINYKDKEEILPFKTSFYVRNREAAKVSTNKI